MQDPKSLLPQGLSKWESYLIHSPKWHGESGKKVGAHLSHLKTKSIYFNVKRIHTYGLLARSRLLQPVQDMPVSSDLGTPVLFARAGFAPCAQPASSRLIMRMGWKNKSGHWRGCCAASLNGGLLRPVGALAAGF